MTRRAACPTGWGFDPSQGRATNDGSSVSSPSSVALAKNEPQRLGPLFAQQAEKLPETGSRPIHSTMGDQVASSAGMDKDGDFIVDWDSNDPAHDGLFASQGQGDVWLSRRDLFVFGVGVEI